LACLQGYRPIIALTDSHHGGDSVLHERPWVAILRTAEKPHRTRWLVPFIIYSSPGAASTTSGSSSRAASGKAF